MTRFFSFDLDRRAKQQLFDVNGGAGLAPVAGGKLLYGRSTDKIGDASVLEIREKSGKVRTISFKADVFGGSLGTEWTAATINAPDHSFGNKPETLVLLNLKSGKTKRIDGLQAVCFTPDGTRLLARRVGDPLSSPLVLLDPDKPTDLVEVGTVPGLAIFSGTWVRGDAPT
ncbi:MAG: hypothetical protein ACT4PP_03165 [Sporichthyaceae bacterium]